MRKPYLIGPTNTTKPAIRQKALSSKECLAKTYKDHNGMSHAGRSVFDHCYIVGSVAKALIRRMPSWLQDSLFPAGSELIAAAHDIGKISPTFQEKIYRAIGTPNNSLSGLETANPEIEKNWGGHAGVSQLTAEKCQVGKYIPEILGQHHGYSPTVAVYQATAPIFGGDNWQERREELICDLKQYLACEWPQVDNETQARVLSGLTTVSDWIGSSSPFENPNQNWHTDQYIQNVLDNAGFIAPKLIPHLTFKEVFNFEAHDSQQKLIEQCTQPGVYILEAPMGLGKTEAALYAAYQTLSSGKATGIYFALPTQLTSDKIHTRFNEFLEQILAPDSHHKALLLHANAWLSDMEMGEDAQPGGAWFHNKKRAILAPFGVGTIDQALMAVMNVKHGFVRTFGLAGKVVILDEVHSYDAYTGTILDALVKELRALHCTVIILSATLTRERRQALLKEAPLNHNYPLISAYPQNSSLCEISVKPLLDSQVKIQFCQNNDSAIEEALCRADQGQQVLWIENTVDEAQQQYKLLAARAESLNIECGLLHSRFLKCDRDKNETLWISLLGKKGALERKQRGRILVGTQIVEQSIDIDSDFLISRICPTDMLLQRLGRLWRHPDTVRPKGSVCEAWILSPTLECALENPEKAFGKTAKVYSPYILYRSLKVWNHLKAIALPGDIRFLIENTYATEPEDNVMKHYKRMLEDRCSELETQALIGLSKGGKTLSENKAQTRYSEQETTDVLLIKSYRYIDNKGVYLVLNDSDEEIYLPRFGNAQGKRKCRELSIKLMKNITKVAEYLAPNAVHKKNIEWLKDYLYLGDEREDNSLVRIAKINPSGELTTLNGLSTTSQYQLHYDSRMGYQSQKIT